jgi:uncharacterized protein (DUF58 family)
MRGTLSHARLLTAAFVVAAVAALGAAAASATTGATTANGATVTASLSPDTVSKGQAVAQTAMVKNVSNAKENLAISIAGPLATSAPTVFSATLAPNASFSKSLTFSAALLRPGKHTLTVTAVNRGTGASTQASASITVN